ncbi:sulfotransferase family protein [Henriciella marina]|uniref:sulfotransferase family protein n=1 Tax=Henriciella marina TaxID=453851 RepID=UPI000591535E|nr:sulfotransferase family protein [Henriciella marina]
MQQQSRLTAVMICGAGHSGSTLLGMILGSHTDTFYMGEGGKARYLGDGSKPLRKRVCKICGEICPVWGGFDWDGISPLYEAVAIRVGKQVIIDSTKDEAWIRARADEVRRVGGTTILLFLSRDGRAVVNSRLRKYPDREPGAQIQAWVDKMASAQALFDDFEGLKMRVRYEDLAENSATTIKTLCALIGVDYQPAMADFTAAEHHVLGGNSGTQFVAARSRFEDPDAAFVSLGPRTRDYYENHSGGIELDLRWKDEMTREHVALFAQMAGKANKPFQWGE